MITAVTRWKVSWKWNTSAAANKKETVKDVIIESRDPALDNVCTDSETCLTEELNKIENSTSDPEVEVEQSEEVDDAIIDASGEGESLEDTPEEVSECTVCDDNNATE